MRGRSHSDEACAPGGWRETFRDGPPLGGPVLPSGETAAVDRSGEAARASLERSLERMGVDQIDSIQLHNLTDEEGWRTAMSPGGALEALVQAKDEGLVRFIGVTGHGTFAPSFHLRSLGEYDFASVLTPYSYTMMAQPEYAADFEHAFDPADHQSLQVQFQIVLVECCFRFHPHPHRPWIDDRPTQRYGHFAVASHETSHDAGGTRR